MRIRITFSKSGMLIFIGTLDLQTIWERSIRRAGFQMQYSLGFHPQPRIQIANPLPLGYSGSQEMIDIWLLGDISPDQLKNRLSSQLPEGLAIEQCVLVNQDAPSSVKQVIASDYRVLFFEEIPDLKSLEKRIFVLLKKTRIIRERRGRSYDLRPLIHKLYLFPNEKSWSEIHMRLSSSPSATGRPDEVMFELGYKITDFSVERCRLILEEEIE